MKGVRKNDSKTTGAETGNATILSVAEKARKAISAGNNRTHSNGGSKKDKCGDGVPIAKSKVSATQPLYNRSRQEEELLYLQRIQAHGPTLLEQGAEKWGNRKKEIRV